MKHALALAALMLLAAPAARAQTFTEMGDAGQTLATAQNASTVTFTHINGGISTSTDADLYKIYISNPAAFSASTINAVTDASGVDTDLFLFDAMGHGIATNDDGNKFTFDAALPSGNALYKNLTAGIYYIGISISGNEPTNGPPPNQLIFSGYPGGDTTAVRGPASGLNPTTLGGFDNFNSDTTTGAYQIDFAGVSAAPAPEPSAWAAFGVGVLGLGALTIKARRRA